MKYDSSYIHTLLTEDGNSITDYFIVDDLIMNLSDFNGVIIPMAFVIEEDDLMQECIHYLKKKGIKQFNSEDEFKVWISKL